MILIPLALVSAQQQAPATIVQKTSGWCSPVIANVTGNVAVNCIGVDPRALKRLNAILDRKNQELTAKIEEANQWAEHYHELENRLRESSSESELSRQAEALLQEGELEKAKAILDQMLTQDEKDVDRVAADHYNRALIAELEFQPLDALPHFEKAYRYRPDDLRYGYRYARLLLRQNDFQKAEPVLVTMVDRARKLAKENPTSYQPDVAKNLNSLAILYNQTQRFKDAESSYLESIEIYRELVKTDTSVYAPE